MSTSIATPTEEALTALAERFEHWRRTRTNGRERIPEGLWDQAVALSAVLSNGRVAKRRRMCIRHRESTTPLVALVQTFLEARGCCN